MTAITAKVVDAVLDALRDKDAEIGQLSCGHMSGTAVRVDKGERIDGGAWHVTETLAEITCSTCGAKTRLTFQDA